jgi:DNA-binding MarR family transcriptional regulator
VPDKPLAAPVDGWLDVLQIATVTEWDVLVFLHRHGIILVKAETIAQLVGYDKDLVGKALDNLVALGLVRRSRSSQGVRFYRYDVPRNSAIEQSTEQLLTLSAERAGRLIVTRRLVARAQRIQAPARGGLRLA